MRVLVAVAAVGILSAFRFWVAGSPSAGQNTELGAIAACVIGERASLAGGVGDIRCLGSLLVHLSSHRLIMV